MTKVCINRKGADRIEAGHPWVFRSDIVEAPSADPGEVVSVHLKNRFLGQAFFNPRSQISIRLLTRTRETIGRDFFKKRIEEATSRRTTLLEKSKAVRLVFGESDLLPSLTLDRYGDVLVFQTLSAGMERWKDDLLAVFEELFTPQAIVERNDPPVRELEGLPRQKGIVRGGASMPLEITAVSEPPLQILVDPIDGQKTGLFLDQAENHRAAVRYARGKALDLFCYQGGFSLSIASVCDEVTAVESSLPALALLRENTARNSLTNIQPVEGNAFDFLRDCHRRGERFNTIILDPPPFSRDRRNLIGAQRGYKEINLRAMKILATGGILITCSCSQNFNPQLFERMLAEAAHDAHRQIQVLEKRGAAPDHPVLLTFPESSYLQCWILRVI